MKIKNKIGIETIENYILDYRKKLDEQLYKDYDNLIKPLFLNDLYYKNYNFVVTDSEYRILEKPSIMEDEEGDLTLRQYTYYEWLITLSLSFTNKVKVTLDQYNKLIEGNEDYHYLLELAIIKEEERNDN